MTALTELTQKLKEIFQIDRADLDFGIYRILNSRSQEIERYLTYTLPEKVTAAFSTANQDEVQALEQALEKLKTTLSEAGVSPEASPKYQEINEKIQAAQKGSANSEAAVFSHLLTFFSRYYEDGDFISQRRYKGDTYAIPYNGEEVMLYWANKDQYYTKSGENFSNYRFTLDDGREVFFRLIAADTAKDNRKDNDGKRVFTLVTARTIEKEDEEGEIYEEEILPFIINNNGQQLQIHFEYQLADKKDKQENNNQTALAILKSDLPAEWQAVWQKAPTDKNPNRTLLEKHLNDYTQKNTADYFIHKDLGGFLRRELDFYIKNEVMHLDNIQEADSFAHIEHHLRQIQTLRSIAHELIDFLAQLENFQKKLWLKKKFVAQTHWLITLDNVPEAFYQDICQNHKQHDAWQQLFALENIPTNMAKFTAFAKEHRHLVIDTSLYPPSFQAALLSQISDAQPLDDITDGLLIHADNFQALNLLQARYREQVKCIYIDPPYNTDSSAILYKNGYKHSSWLSLIERGLLLSKELQRGDSFCFIAIDDLELFRLNQMANNIFGESNFISNVSVIHKPEGRNQEKFFGTSIEYMLVYAKNKSQADFYNVILDKEQKQSFDLSDEQGLYKRKNFIRLTDGKYALREAKPEFYYPIYVSNDLSHIDIVPFENSTAVFPITDNQVERTWKTKPDTFMEYHKKGNIEVIKEGNKIVIYEKLRENQVIKTHWNKKEYHAYHYGTKLLENIFGRKEFSFPKSIALVKDTLTLCTKFNEVILDYFAGSGTTAHAVINLNREDNGKRKYILVEQGEYFNTVLKPRIEKVIYSENWKNGKPVADKEKGYNGVSQIVKVLKLESYEDTLNNLVLKGQQDLLSGLPESVREDYLLHYMLDTQSKDSLLNTDDFRRPFAYRLNIATDSAGAYQPCTVDLVETFNYLLGLQVHHINDQREKQHFVTVEGVLPSGERCLVFWRDVEKVDAKALQKHFDKLNIQPQSSQYDVVYVNGDHHIATIWQGDNDTATKTLKLRPIEPTFLSLMFAEENV